MNEQTVIRAKEYIQKLFEGNSDGHDAAHSLRVYRNAMLIADAVDECDRYAVALAALLHDADDHKLFDTKDNANARAFLHSESIDDEMTDKICRIINSVSFSKNRDKAAESIEEMIVRDADRLDAIGAVGIARTFAYGGKAGRGMEDSVQHFYDKLLLLKDMMNTEAAKRIAEQRHGFMLSFLDELDRELSQGE
ncbi:MAG: HD domain-containing protein [Oscillospiraceae bacterium]|nr:HD domain-containing protein [Oscillospiraceae bacterium]